MQTFNKIMRNAYATHIDYGAFKGLIPSNPAFCPSNIDGIAERNGKFLVMEWKRPNEKVSEGQRRLLQAFAKTHNFTVIIVQGNTDDELVIQDFWQVQPYGSCVKLGQGVEEFKAFYVMWYEYANQKTL
jgi:hypothetical protein